MKQLKYLAMAALMVGFAACSDDDEVMNSATATVEFESSAVTYNENFGIVQVPLQVTGELNGSIRATFSVEPLQGAVENEHYVVTTNQIIIPSSLDGTFACELHLLDDGVNENDNRAVRITLESVEGATVGNNASCMVTIADVDYLPYYKLLGDYVLTAVSAIDGQEVSFAVNLSDGASQADKVANAERRYVATGFDAVFGITGETWEIEYNKAAESVSIVPADPYITEDMGLSDGTNTFTASIIPMTLTGGYSTYLNGTWNETFDTITFDPQGGLVGVGLFLAATGEYAGAQSAYANVVLTKVQ